MSDHERGAYTPQPDAPLSFDARTPRDQRSFPVLLIASCVILAAMVVAAFLLYRSGVRGQNEPPRPVGEPIANIKAAPVSEDVGNTTASSQSAAGGPNFAPGPEQPVNRTAQADSSAAQASGGQGLSVRPAPDATARLATAPPPPQQPAPQPPAPQQSAAPIQAAPAPAPVQQAPAKTAPVKAAAAKPAPTLKSTPAVEGAAPTTKPRPAPKAKPTRQTVADVKPSAKAAKPAPVAKGTFLVQIGADGSEALAEQSWKKVSALMGAEMHGHGRRTEPVTVGAGTRYRSQVTGFASRPLAIKFCEALKAKGHACIVKAAE